jgi:AcrR family transcriptional regulator
MRSEILAAARELMREQGVAALSWNEVARRVGIKPPSLYAYFDSKMALYDGLFALGMRLFAAHLAQRAQTPGDLRGQIYTAIEGYMSFAQANPDLYQLCFERPVPGFVPSADSMALSLQVLSQSGQASVAFIAQIASGLSITFEQARDLGIAMIHGLTAQHMANEPHLPAGSGRYGGLIPAAVELFARSYAVAKPGAKTSRPASPEKETTHGKRPTRKRQANGRR